jgi:deazaflavin-dependent oxidoreductase (nitroreductase family)
MRREATIASSSASMAEAMVVVATNDGGTTHPAWYLNLTSNPAGTVEVDGRRLDVVSSELAGDEASGWWRQIVERSPDYERYTRAAHRTLPILRLAPAKPMTATQTGS